MIVNHHQRLLKRKKTTAIGTAAAAADAADLNLNLNLNLNNLNDFLTFPGREEEEDENLKSGALPLPLPFRSRISCFLVKHAHRRPMRTMPSNSSFSCWKIFLRIRNPNPSNQEEEEEDDIVTVDVVEEDVPSSTAKSSSLYCDECRVIGWSRHPVCGKRYHFIISRNNPSSGFQSIPCKNCGRLFHDHTRCKSCNYELTALDVRDWISLQLGDTTHLLHGVVHGNGYGHLRRVNGREGGSLLLSGCDIMNFWDRLCTTLRVRKISVMDVSRKYGLEFRLLHAVTNGHTWYGDWGFEFGAGSFAINVDAYRKAVEFLSSVPLSILFQARQPSTRLQDVISFYQALSDTPLSTVRELFCFLMEMMRKTEWSQVESKGKKYEFCSRMLSTWTRKDIERVQQCMIKVLKVAGGNCWVSWLSLKGAAFRLGTSEQLDYCLKVLDGVVLDDGRMVISRCNPETYAIEYSLVSRSRTNGASSLVGSNCLSKDHILLDLKYLYDALLNPGTILIDMPKTTRDMAVSAARTLLDCKQFVKDYESGSVANANSLALSISCKVQLMDQPMGYTVPPPELIFLPLKATIADLKSEAAKVFRETYMLFRRFKVEELVGYGELNESRQLEDVIGSSGSVTVRGRLLLLHGLEHFRMERGVEVWTVRCKCGAKDDDGERMLACDSCGIWQHTRCAGIDDLDPVPETFECFRCISTKQPTKHYCRPDANTKPTTALSLSKKGLNPCNKILSATRLNSEMQSPSQSGVSGLTNCKDEFTDAVPVSIDACYLESSNRSGTTSEETSAVLDTCSSKVGFIKNRKEKWYGYNGEVVATPENQSRKRLYSST